MTRETKIGLLLGMGVILLIGIIISDQLTQKPSAADFTGFGQEAQRSIDASDAAPASGYAGSPTPGDAGNPGFVTPGNQPAGTSPVIEPPSNFFIPSDRLPSAVSPRQADGTTPDSSASTNRPLTAYNVDGSSRYQTDGQVPTLRVGQDNAELPHTTAISTATDAPSSYVPTPRSADSVIRHTVLKGETLTKIARRHYGNGDYWRTIANANPGKVTRDGQVQLGAVLNIPKRDDAVLGLDSVSAGSEQSVRVDTRITQRPGKTITVESGDTLSELATKHLGSATRWQDLMDANRDKLDDPQGLQVGMKLRLPGAADSTPATTSTPGKTPKPNSGDQTYTVRPGDNLTEIAEKTLSDGGKWQVIYQANRDRLKSPDRLIVGQKLRIPR